jgi:hypothetical protein
VATHVGDAFAYRERVDKCSIGAREKAMPAKLAVFDILSLSVPLVMVLMSIQNELMIKM